MNKISLKQILSSGDFDNGIKGNLGLSDEDFKFAIKKTISVELENSISVEITVDGTVKDFENTLYTAIDKSGKQIYLLESRLFNKVKDQMINAYLEVFNSKLVKVENFIDDVWSYADWKKVK